MDLGSLSGKDVKTLNDSVVQSINAKNSPTPRMGHTTSLVGNKMVVICVLMFDNIQ